jgi:formylglycine-generating enzyme required for sulfatase activity
LASGWRFRLPTEAEWEYSARAGTTGRYSFGDDPESVEIYRQACFMDSGYVQRRARLVTAKPPNPWGLHGLYGNVGEWCADWYGRYAGGSVADPQGPAFGTNRVYRSGGFIFRARDCRCASRKYANPNDRQAYVGFRIVLAPVAP